jgi:teichoic acid transport system permease protein
VTQLVDLHRPVGITTYLRRLWRLRDFVLLLPASQLRAQMGVHRLGIAWLLLNPLLYAAVYWGVFGVLLGTSRGVEHFPAFLVTGVFAFHFFQRSVNAALRTVQRQRALIQQIGFPRVALPVASTLGELYLHLPGLAVVVLLAWATGVPPSARWLLLVPACAVLTTFNLGVAMLAARAASHVRDLQQLTPHVLRVLLYVSGVLFPAQLVADRAGTTVLRIFEANPIWTMLSLYRQAVLGDPVTASTWLAGLAWAVGSVILGLVWFRQRELRYVDG